MRATKSISAAIAEGAGRESRPDFARFISMAIASASEVEHDLHVGNDLGLLDDARYSRVLARCIEVRRMLFGLHEALLLADEGSRSGQSAKREVVEPPTG
jgi:four helix bundle protein